MNLSEDNKIVQGYVKTLEQCNCISPGIIAGLPHHYSAFDFSKESHRLFWAIHYITISSQRFD